MKVHFTGGIGALSAPLRQKIDDRFVKLGKLLDGRGEKEAHVVITSERHLQHAEIQVHFYGHSLVGLSKDPDLFSALCGAADKLEKQLLKTKTKWRDGKRSQDAKIPVIASRQQPAPEPVAARTPAAKRPKVYRVNHRADRKPMTLEEAMLSADGQDYVVFQDAGTDRTSVLVRRRDGHFDLIES